MTRRLGLGSAALAMGAWILTACPEEPTTNTGVKRGSLILSSADANGNAADEIPADGVSYLLIQIIARGGDGKPYSGNVDLGTDLGAFAGAVPSNSITVSTDAEGKASVQFICAKPQSGEPELPGAAAITARNPQASARAQVYCTELPDNRSLRLSYDDSITYHADGETLIRLSATLTDLNGDPWGGAPVVFETTDGNAHLVGTSGVLVTSVNPVTNNMGVATAELKAPESPTSIMIKASWTDGTDTREDSVNISFSADQSAITLTANPSAAPADGASPVEIKATALGYQGSPVPEGTDITFTITSGTDYSFDGTLNQDVVVPTTGATGEAVATLNASLTQGTATVKAEFEVASGSVRHSPSIDVAFVEPGQILLDISVDMPEIFSDDPIGGGEVAQITVVAKRDGSPLATQNLTFALSDQDATVATFGSQGANRESAVTVKRRENQLTDTDGSLTVELRGLYPGAAGNVSVIISTTDPQNGDQTTTVTAQILVKRNPLLQSVIYVGASPDMLGTQGSPRESTSILTFQALNDNSEPMEGVLFVFDLTDDIHDPFISVTTLGGGNSTFTDAGGLAIAFLSAGVQAEPVRVIATATDLHSMNTLIVASDSIPITSGLTSWSHSWFICDDASETMAPPGTRTCEASLADRFSERVPGGTTVQLRVESGNITPNSIVGGDGAAGGITYITGAPPPSDTVDANGSLGTINATDNMVAMLAYTRGEEPFTDVNGNGVYDPGEPFVDFPEPYVDKQDNCVRNDATDPTDRLYVDPSGYRGGVADPYLVMLNTDPFIDGDGNNVWNGPNGRWDSDAMLWFQERTLLVYPAVALDIVDADCADSSIPNQAGYPDSNNPSHVAYHDRCQSSSHVPWISAGEPINLRFRAYDSYGNCAAPGKTASYSWSATNAEGSGTRSNGAYGCGLGGEISVDPVSGHLQPFCTTYRNAEIDSSLRVTVPGLGALPFSGSFDTGSSQIGQPIKITITFTGESSGGSLTWDRNLTYVVPCRDNADCGATYVDTDGGQVLAQGSATCDLYSGMCVTP